MASIHTNTTGGGVKTIVDVGKGVLKFVNHLLAQILVASDLGVSICVDQLSEFFFVHIWGLKVHRTIN